VLKLGLSIPHGVNCGCFADGTGAISGLVQKIVTRHENSAFVVGIREFSVRQFLINNIISGQVESAIDNNLKEEIFIRKENKMAYRQNYSQGRNDKVRFNLMEHIGVLSQKDNGWTREVNIVAWNDGPGKVDIREWDPEHKRMTKGVTLFEEEAERLAEVLAGRYGFVIRQVSDQNLSFAEERPAYEERPVFEEGAACAERPAYTEAPAVCDVDQNAQSVIDSSEINRGLS
jgi:hypothetical protein